MIIELVKYSRQLTISELRVKDTSSRLSMTFLHSFTRANEWIKLLNSFFWIVKISKIFLKD